MGLSSVGDLGVEQSIQMRVKEIEMRRNPLGLMTVLIGLGVVPTLLTLSSKPEMTTPVNSSSCPDHQESYCG